MGLIVRLSDRLAKVELASVTCTMKKKVPLVSGVPEMPPPVERFKLSGRLGDPGASDQPYGNWPPEAWS